MTGAVDIGVRAPDRMAAGQAREFLRAIASSRTGLFGAIVVAAVAAVAILAPWLAPYAPAEVDIANRLQAPGAAHWMGTDFAGRDVLSRVMWGARPSLQVGVLSVLIGLPGGLAIGLLAGFYRGSILETVLMRATEIIAAVPLLIVAIAVVGVLGVKQVGTDQNAAIHLYTHERACPEARSARGRGCPMTRGRGSARRISAVSARADSRAA